MVTHLAQSGHPAPPAVLPVDLTTLRLSALYRAKRDALAQLAAAENELDQANAALGQFAREERKKWRNRNGN